MATDLSYISFGLLGKSLGHSWSKHIHSRLGGYSYSYFEHDEKSAADFIRTGNWKGLNVTIPYKQLAYSLAHERSERAQAVKAANTLVRNDDGRIFADNTDILGFSFALDHFLMRELGVSANDMLSGKCVLILGTGGAAKAVEFALKSFGAFPVLVSRTGSVNYQNAPNYHPDTVLIVNATPAGMYPNCPDTPLPEGFLERLPKLRAVFDLIYNPLRTKLMLHAQSLGIAAENGLYMLVAQAFFASQLFQGKELKNERIDSISSELFERMINVVLIGMPGAGKSSAGKLLARHLGRPFVDLDQAIAIKVGKSPEEIITNDGVECFRELETSIANEYCKESGLVIATGGGIVTRPQNYDIVRQNSHVVFLDRPLNELDSKGRPLSKEKGVLQLAQERLWLYRSWSDLAFSCTGSAQGDAEAVAELLFNETFSA